MNPYVINYIITILALLGALIAWIVKLKWSKEFIKSKDAEIAAYKAQLDVLNEKNSLLDSLSSGILIENSKKTIAELEDLIRKRDLQEVEKDDIAELKEIINNFINTQNLKQRISSRIEENDKENNRSRTISEFVMELHQIFRTPFNGIIGFTAIVEHNLKEGKDKKYLELARKNAQALLKIIEDFLTALDNTSDLTELENEWRKIHPYVE